MSSLKNACLQLHQLGETLTQQTEVSISCQPHWQPLASSGRSHKRQSVRDSMFLSSNGNKGNRGEFYPRISATTSSSIFYVSVSYHTFWKNSIKTRRPYEFNEVGWAPRYNSCLSAKILYRTNMCLCVRQMGLHNLVITYNFFRIQM